MKTLSDLERLFFREKRPYWVIYDKKGVRKAAVTENIMQTEDKKERLDESWNCVLEAETDLDAGEYKMVLMTHENAGKGKIVHDFVIGNPQQSASVGNTGRISSQGVSGLNGIQGVELVMGLMNSNQNELNRYRDQIQDLKLDALKKENEIERIRREKKEKKEDDGIGGLIKGIVKEHFPAILKTVYPQSYAPTTVIASVESPNSEVNSEEAASKMEFQKRFAAIFERLAQMFPNENPLEVIETVLDMAQESEMVVEMVQKKLKKAKK
ncbi:MAG: hypothetical protein RLZZ628_2025 [Bacteroidota bacterium]|jgi:hypothetical protein